MINNLIADEMVLLRADSLHMCYLIYDLLRFTVFKTTLNSINIVLIYAKNSLKGSFIHCIQLFNIILPLRLINIYLIPFLSKI